MLHNIINGNLQEGNSASWNFTSLTNTDVGMKVRLCPALRPTEIFKKAASRYTRVKLRRSVKSVKVVFFSVSDHHKNKCRVYFLCFIQQCLFSLETVTHVLCVRRAADNLVLIYVCV